MKMLWVIAAAIVMSTSAVSAGGDSFSGPDGDPAYAGANRSLYDRIVARYAHYGRDVEEEFRDGPCRIERYWERDGDFEEKIKCEGPRD
jgi:hypothetical protein